jgi:nitrate reductase assembly molybdenum cofactor insertion protein NarJ
MVLSAADEDEPEDDLAATRYWLKKATEALEEAKRVYIHDPEDATILQTTEDMIEEENEALHRRVKAFYSDDSDDYSDKASY